MQSHHPRTTAKIGTRELTPRQPSQAEVMNAVRDYPDLYHALQDVPEPRFNRIAFVVVCGILLLLFTLLLLTYVAPDMLATVL